MRPRGSTPFILLATQRTGSSWAQEMLDSHPAIKVYNELFHADSRGRPMWGHDDIEFINTFWESRVRRPRRIARPFWTVAYLRRVFDQPGFRAVGFKYMYNQIPRSRVVLPYAALRGVRVVHLVRSNLLDTVISARRAEHTRLYHLPTDGRPPIPWLSTELTDVKIRLEPREVLADLARLSRERRLIRAWLRASHTPTLEVEYETLATDATRFGRILKFLGLPSVDASRLYSGLRKIGTALQSDVVENYGELQAALTGTRFEPFLSRRFELRA